MKKKWILIATGYGQQPSTKHWFDQLAKKRTGVQNVGTAQFRGSDVVSFGIPMQPRRKRAR